MNWVQQNLGYIPLLALLGWFAWQRILAPRLAGVRNISAGEYLRMRDTAHTLVDVRTEREWQAGHAPKAVHVPLSSLVAHLDRIPRKQPVVVICASGNRSAVAAVTLARKGFAPVYNFSGGMAAWQSAGLPVKRGR
ncbi:MAG: rhodanese-like domain-containing protein [Zetaproteobacteria bacterium]|nr:MAG: rhodanese-like domain-containing protein [Zetaproteobacteria bacterium]